MTFSMNNETNLNCLFLEKSQNKLLMNQDNYINQSVVITTNVVSLIPANGEVYSIQYYVIKFVSDLRKVDGFFLFE
jgi:hypothetical protein